MRGTRKYAEQKTKNTGIIPAYAGNTCRCIRHWFSARDHPRVCGEHTCDYVNANTTQGSSPRMRGTHLLRFVCDYGTGIIPAYAGNTYWKLHELYVRRDHPRVCGEHLFVHVGKLHALGSSPRMRGTRRMRLSPRAWSGIIAAYAGNTRYSRPSDRRGRDHPRVCGEHHQTVGSRFRRTGIIPAYAGNTTSIGVPSPRTRDHPRVCGEHLNHWGIYGVSPGSSPRMRGTLPRDVTQFETGGIIPAYAGNTLRD